LPSTATSKHSGPWSSATRASFTESACGALGGRIGRADWADDIAQLVFIALASKAPSLIETRSLAGWLHRAASVQSIQMARNHATRKRYHAMYKEQHSSEQEHDGWENVRPHLDAALEQLASIDRDVVLLHYFEGWSFKEIAERLGTKAGTAQKRSVRTLAKLTRILRRRGVIVPVTMLATHLSSELASGRSIVGSTTLASTALAGSSATTLTQTFIMSMITIKKSAVVGTLLAAVFGGALGLGSTIGVARLMGPIQSEGPEAAVLRALGSEQAETASAANQADRYAEMIAAWEELMIQLVSAVTGKERDRVIAAGRYLYAAEPEGFWLAMDEGLLSGIHIQTKRGGVIESLADGSSGFGTSGAVIAMEFLERGYARGNGNVGSLVNIIELAANEHPERCVRWMEEQADGELAHEIMLDSPWMIVKMPDYLQERVTKVYERIAAARRARGEPLTRNDVAQILAQRALRNSGSYSELAFSDPSPYLDRMLLALALLPAFSTLDEGTYKYVINSTERSKPLSSALEKLTPGMPAAEQDFLLAAIARDPGLRRAAEASGVAFTETQHREFAARDLLDVVSKHVNTAQFGSELNEKLANWPSPENWPLARGVYENSIAKSILLESEDIHASLVQLDHIPDTWRDSILSDAVEWWANHDVVAASKALSQLENVPDAAIAELVKEIAGDREAAEAWASMIQDPTLRDSTLKSKP
jgi:RNA polymerase sigma factor (sigma-70 family)